MIIYRNKEIDYAEKIIKDGFQTNFTTYELKILAKYYKYKDNKPKERKALLYEFCEKNILSFNKVKYFKIINTALNHAANKNSKIIQIDSINITKNEVEYVNNLNVEYDHKKVLFCLFVESKLNILKYKMRYNEDCNGKLFGGAKGSYYKDLSELAGLPQSVDINKIINHLSDAGLVTTINRGKIYLTFIDNITINEDIAFKINTFDNTGMYFDYYNGSDKVIKCERCEILVEKTVNNKKYCDSCSKEIKMKKDRERMETIRNSRKQENWLNLVISMLSRFLETIAYKEEDIVISTPSVYFFILFFYLINKYKTLVIYQL